MLPFFSRASKKLFFLIGQAFTPSPSLSGRATKKRTFCGFPKSITQYTDTNDQILLRQLSKAPNSIKTAQSANIKSQNKLRFRHCLIIYLKYLIRSYILVKKNLIKTVIYKQSRNSDSLSKFFSSSLFRSDIIWFIVTTLFWCVENIYRYIYMYIYIYICVRVGSLRLTQILLSPPAINTDPVWTFANPDPNTVGQSLIKNHIKKHYIT